MNATSNRLRVCVRGMVALAAIAFYGTAASFDPPKDPCSLLMPQEVISAIGANSGPHQVVPTLCEWVASGPSSTGRSAKITVGFLSASAWVQTKAMRENMKGTLRIPVSDLGEEAVFSTNEVVNTLQIKKGSVVLDLHIYDLAPSEAKAKGIVLARAALERF
jgi:hypothetical protein